MGLSGGLVEKHEPVSDIDTVVVDSLKALDPEWPIREADINGTEIPQCGGLLAHRVCYRLGGSTGAGSAATHLDSEQFRSDPRTCRPLCGRLSMRWTDRRRQGGRKPDVRHEAAGVHHAARRRDCVVDTLAVHCVRAASRSNAAHWNFDAIRRERHGNSSSPARISTRVAETRLD